jgi:hypothetical protein
MKYASKTPLLLSAFTLSLGALAACGDDPADGPDAPPAGTARFAEMTADEQHDSIEMALGGAAAMPVFAVFGASIDSADAAGCPALTEDGLTSTFEGGGCTTSNGNTYDGRLVAHNVPGFSGENADPTQPMRIELDAWDASGLIYDGLLEQSTPQPASGEVYTTSLDYTLSAGAFGARFQLDTECTQRDGDAGNPCTLAGTFEVDGLGSFAIVGEVALGAATASGWLELRGADTLRVDLDAMEDGCAPYTIDGVAAGEICDDTEPPPASELEISGGGGGCGGETGAETLDALTWVRGDAARVDATLFDDATGTEETHAMAHDSYDAEADEHTWRVELAVAETGFTCEAELTYKFEAFDAEGGSVCFAMGPAQDRYAAEGCIVW